MLAAATLVMERAEWAGDGGAGTGTRGEVGFPFCSTTISALPGAGSEP